MYWDFTGHRYKIGDDGMIQHIEPGETTVTYPWEDDYDECLDAAVKDSESSLRSGSKSKYSATNAQNIANYLSIKNVEVSSNLLVNLVRLDNLLNPKKSTDMQKKGTEYFELTPYTVAYSGEGNMSGIINYYDSRESGVNEGTEISFEDAKFYVSFIYGYELNYGDTDDAYLAQMKDAISNFKNWNKELYDNYIKSNSTQDLYLFLEDIATQKLDIYERISKEVSFDDALSGNFDRNALATNLSNQLNNENRQYLAQGSYIAINEYVELFPILSGLGIVSGIGEYGKVGGHHVHAKSAFRGDMSYNPSKGFSISQEFMEENGWNHQKMTSMQRQLYNELAKSGRANTLKEHTRIAVKALEAGGATYKEARSITAKSLWNLRQQGVRSPFRIPWNDRR